MSSSKKKVELPKNHPKLLNAWASYDWANSVYNLTITAAIFPVFFEGTTKAAFGGDKVQFFGGTFIASVLYANTIALSFLIAAILSPLLSGMADYGGKKKLMMKFFTYTGATACFVLYFFTGPNVELGIIAALIASMGYSGAIVFYNSYLPDIATDDKVDQVSAKGYSLGFLGSVLQLSISLLIIFNHQSFHIDQVQATRLSFLFVAIWWVSFAQIAFAVLPENVYHKRPRGNLFKKGFQELEKVWKNLKQMPNLKLFLIAFFVYAMGAQSIFLLATLFGSKVLKMESSELITVILFLQLVGILGAYLFAYISGRKGNKFALYCILIFWLALGVYGYFITTKTEFYIMAGTFGVAMGGYHLSRSTYAKLIPENTTDTTSYFSFYDVMEKLATALGPFSYGAIEYLTGNMRYSIIALGIYFIVAMSILYFVRIPRGEILIKQS